MRLTHYFSLAIIGLFFALGTAQAAEQTFAKPKQGAYRVDWCYQWGTLCGKLAADRFCQSKSFIESSDFEEAVNIGSLTPTVVQASGQICNGPDCDGFTYITCVKPDLPLPPPPLPLGGGSGGADEREYLKPKLGGYRVNYCETKGVGCGQDAADSFCDAKGYDDAADFEQSGPVPYGSKPSRYIGNNKLCKGPGCYAFNTITCENQP